MSVNFIDGTEQLIEFDRNTPNVSKTLEHIKDMANTLCKRKETLLKDETNIPRDFIVEQLNNLRKDSKYFGYCVYKPCIIYGERKIRPIAVLIARSTKRGSSYIVSLLCRHAQARKGLGRELLTKLAKKAKAEGLQNLFLESIPGAEDAYTRLGFVDDDKYIYTDSPEDSTLVGMSLDIDTFLAQKGGGCSVHLVAIDDPSQQDEISMAKSYVIDNNKETFEDFAYHYLVYAKCGDEIVGVVFLERMLTPVGAYKVESDLFCMNDTEHGLALLSAIETLVTKYKLVRINITCKDPIVLDFLQRNGYRITGYNPKVAYQRLYRNYKHK